MTLWLYLYLCNISFYSFGIAVGIYHISENVSIFQFYQNIHDCTYCLLSLCKRSNRKSNFKDVNFLDLIFNFMTSLTVVLFLKRRLLKIAKSPVLSTGGNDNSKSRYGNDLKFVMTFLNR